MRAATGRSLGRAVCVCVKYIVYCITLDRTCTDTLSQPRARLARLGRLHGSVYTRSQETHAHLAPTHICADMRMQSLCPQSPSALGLSGRAELTARVGNPGMPSARTHPPHCRQRAAVTTVCGQLCALPPLLRCQLANGHASSWPRSLCMACAAISHQASLSSIFA